METFQNPMEVFKLLDKSNCRKCEEPTCLAFAAMVFKAQKDLSDCPMLSDETLERFGGKKGSKIRVNEEEGIKYLNKLKQQVAAMNLKERAAVVEGEYANNRLTIRVCGKNFSIDKNADMYSDIHIHQWLSTPVLSHIIHAKGEPLTHIWTPLRELKSGREIAPLFEQRTEKPLKAIADEYPELFEDMTVLFNGKEIDGPQDSDISVILHPLPKVPVLISYWKPDEGMESHLSILFDRNAESELPLQSIYTLGTGLGVMFGKIALRHGVKTIQ